MKQFYIHHHQNIIWQSIQSGLVISLFVFAILRIFFYEFPMTWGEEITFFLKAYCASCFIFTTAMGGIACLYWSLLKIKKYIRVA